MSYSLPMMDVFVTLPVEGRLNEETGVNYAVILTWKVKASNSSFIYRIIV